MRIGRLAALLVLALAAAHALSTVSLLGSMPPAARAANLALLAVELTLCGFAALLFATLGPPPLPRAPGTERGAVDVLVPVRNEDARVLRSTLAALARVRPAGGPVRVLVVDDSDAARAADVAAACREAGAALLRREARRGYKAGALNDALARTDAPFVAVLDVDHEPEPGFLADAMAHMAPGVAYVQTRLEWRNDDAPIRRLASILQHQFYHGVQREKGARSRAVFAGSAALFRREALASVGGFPEATLVEDFDLTLRLANAGWRGRLAPVVGARGLLPWSAADLARQLWRWAHGTTQVVGLRLRETLSARQARFAPRAELLLDGLAYVAGGAFVAAALLLVAMAVAETPLVRPLGGWALLLAPLLVAMAHMASAAAALRQRGRGGFAWLPAYHLVSLAFTPVLFVATLTAWLPVRAEGRVAKARAPSRAMPVGLAVAGLLGAALLATGFAGLPLPAASWAAFLGVAFFAPLLVSLAPERAHADRMP